MTPDESRRTTIIRGAPRALGRAPWIPPGASGLRVLHGSRIHTDARLPPIRVDPGEFETALVCLDGVGWIRVGTERFRVEPYDTVYVPRDTHFMVWSASAAVDVAELRAPVEERHPVQYVTYARQRDEWADHHPERDPRLCVMLGGRAAAGRISVGVITGHATHDLSPWPAVPVVPQAEVACCYARMAATQPLPIEWTFTSNAQPAHVYQGDVVIGPHRWRDGHTAGGDFAVLWMLAAEQETVGDRFRLPAHVLSRSRAVP